MTAETSIEYINLTDSVNVELDFVDLDERLKVNPLAYADEYTLWCQNRNRQIDNHTQPFGTELWRHPYFASGSKAFTYQCPFIDETENPIEIMAVDLKRSRIFLEHLAVENEAYAASFRLIHRTSSKKVSLGGREYPRYIFEYLANKVERKLERELGGMMVIYGSEGLPVERFVTEAEYNMAVGQLLNKLIIRFDPFLYLGMPDSVIDIAGKYFKCALAIKKDKTVLPKPYCFAESLY